MDDKHVALPLGIVALTWLRLYLPMVAANLPQAPGNRRGAEGLGFAGPGFQAVAAGAATLPGHVANVVASLDTRHPACG